MCAMGLCSCASNPTMIASSYDKQEPAATGKTDVAVKNGANGHGPGAEGSNAGVQTLKPESQPLTPPSSERVQSLKRVAEETDDEDSVIGNLPAVNLDAEILRNQKAGSNDGLIAKEIKRLLLEFGEDKEQAPDIFFKEVKAYITIFQTNPQYRGFITASLKRSSRHLSMVKGIFNERGIPEDMAYIAFIESGFSRMARSRAGAAGMWQFMPGTARNYSLRVNKTIDDRFDHVKSTYAAVEYFHDLIAIFGPRSFLLALAAYNCGEYKIISCLKKIDDPFEQRNFWHIRGCLAKETQEYPPKIIAAAIVGNNPAAFGFPRFEPVEGGDTEIAVASVTPRVGKKAPVTPQIEEKGVPRRETKAVKAAPKQRTVKKAAKPKLLIYTARKGNTLSVVAEAFNTSVQDLKQWNNMKSDVLPLECKLKIYPKGEMERITYKVRKGDSIREIGDSFRVRPVHIIVCNGLKNGWQLKPGQNLVFFKEIKTRPVVYTVQKGSNLTLISNKYHVTVKDLIMWNNLSSSTLIPRQKLKIYASI